METQTKAEYWQRQIKDWKASGLNQKQFCLSRSLALSTFCYWKSKTNRIEPITPKFYPLTIPVLPGNSSGTQLLCRVQKRGSSSTLGRIQL
ncbi:MAG: hypothetical protein ACI8ZB_003502 [Desulforhopalus sp.]|jgi:hypothetical protein